MKNFWVRTLSALVYVVLFLGTLLSGRLLGNPQLGLALFGAFLLFVAVGGTFEFYRIVRSQQASPCQWLGYLLVVAVMVVTIVIPLLNGLAGFKVGLLSIMVVPALFPLAVIAQLWKHSDQPFRDAAYTLVPALYLALPLSLMIAMIPDVGARVVLMLILMVWSNDNFAYMGGSLVGKHKMWERHSPGKTWEGTAIGVLLTIVLASFIGPLIQPAVAWYHWTALAAIVSVAATLGDLAESMLKRSVQFKDSGRIMPGHGGFLDRFDSLLVAVPFAFLYIFLAEIL